MKTKKMMQKLDVLALGGGISGWISPVGSDYASFLEDKEWEPAGFKGKNGMNRLIRRALGTVEFTGLRTGKTWRAERAL